MHVTDASSWDQFPSWLQTLEDERRRLVAQAQYPVSTFLFRGQGNASWKLATTLERAYPHMLRGIDYYQAAYTARHAIEAHTGKSWDMPDTQVYSVGTRKLGPMVAENLPAMEYLAYLRHHAFPSPLLDWTASPFVAAYFAFESPGLEATRVAIYAYLEHAGEGKVSPSEDVPFIIPVGPTLRTDRRHFLQQSQYTLCIIRDRPFWRYTDHEAALQSASHWPQDLMWKFTVPVTEKYVALAHLDKFNLNAFSLFGSEESLVRTIAFRSFGGTV